MKTTLQTAALIALAAIWGCTENSLGTDEPAPELNADEVEVSLNLNVVSPTVVGKPVVNDQSRADEGGDGEDDTTVGTAKEESVRDIWVFQFDKNGDALVAPRYYTVTSDVVENLNIRLVEAEDCHLYVLANTGDEEWVAGKDFSTLEKFKATELAFSSDMIIKEDDNDYIPMIGDVAGLTFHKQADLKPVDIYLTRMLSKISFSFFTAAAAEGLKVSKIYIHNLPTGIRLEHDDEAEIYPSGDFETQFFELNKNLASGVVHTFYMPENRQGITDNTDAKLKSDGAPSKALRVELFISSTSNGSNFVYTIYPGENAVNDYNVRRNHNYNIVLNLNSEGRDNRVLAAPANCFVMRKNDEIMFDPYTRTETGGGFRYSDYVNKTVPGKRIRSVGIVWQQEGVIGNNSAGNLVWIDEYDRVHVKSGASNGSALIAGYNGDNLTGDIVWSWHIWVNNEDPGKLANAVPYYTFEWDASGIKTSKGRSRKGRSLMTCNLGARSATPTTPNLTFGCLYQWGRKDPFPGGWNVTSWVGGQAALTPAVVGKLYNNSYSAIPMTTGGNVVATTELFRTVVTSASVGTIEYTIKNPTKFISPMMTPNTGNQNPEASTGQYVSGTDGDWCWGHNDALWGGTPFASAMQYVVDAASGAILSDNGAKEKSIFDPCPAGWMVPPGDMWLGFTINGVNYNEGSSTTYPNMNTAENKSSNEAKRGYYMYMSQTYKSGRTVFFPSAGLRMVSGAFNQIGFCGNYHTTTGGKGGRTNAFHMHTPSFMYPFETGYGYTRRSTASNVRCVRDVDE